MIKKFIYNKLRKALEKKASVFYSRKYFAARLELEGFHDYDILEIKVFPDQTQTGFNTVYVEKMKLSENSQQLDLFLTKVKKMVNNFDREIYSKIVIDFENKKDEISLTYFDKEKNRHPFKLIDKF